MMMKMSCVSFVRPHLLAGRLPSCFAVPHAFSGVTDEPHPAPGRQAAAGPADLPTHPAAPRVHHRQELLGGRGEVSSHCCGVCRMELVPGCLHAWGIFSLWCMIASVTVPEWQWSSFSALAYKLPRPIGGLQTASLTCSSTTVF